MALLEAREHAIASGDMRRQIEAWNEVGGAMLFGRTPLDEVLAFLDEELAWARSGSPGGRGRRASRRPYVYARLGRFEQARDRLERSKAICRDLGIAYGLAEAHRPARDGELAGDAGRRAGAPRGDRRRTEMGASRYIALYRTRSPASSWIWAGRRRPPPSWSRHANVYGDAPKWKSGARAGARAPRQGDVGGSPRPRP